MNNKAKKYIYSAAGLVLATQASVASATSGLGNAIKGTSDADQFVNDSSGNLVETAENFLGYIIGLLYLIAVIYGLYGGFQILTAGGDDGKVKSGKTTLINAALGLAAIFLSSVVINWVISLFASGGTDSVIG